MTQERGKKPHPYSSDDCVLMTVRSSAVTCYFFIFLTGSINHVNLLLLSLFFCVVVENPVPLQPLADNEPSQNYFIFLFPLAGYLLMGPHMLTREPLNSGVRGASAAL